MTLIILLVLALLGLPLITVMGLTGLYYMLTLSNPQFLKIIPQMMVSGIYTFPLLAIPFFIMAGIIMVKSEIVDSIVTFARVFVGHFRGGMAYVNILTSVFFAGVSGSAVADTSALGSMLIPAMEKSGYSRRFSAAVTASSSIIGPIIPPSIIAIIYASTIGGVSVSALFLAGIMPGLLMGLGLCLVVYIIGKRTELPAYPIEGLDFRSFLVLTKEALSSLLMPLIILSGILFGIFTPTEAGAIAVVYALVIGFFIKRTLKLKAIPQIMMETGAITSVVYLIIATSMIIQWVIGKEHVAELIVAVLTDIATSKFLMLLIVASLILVVGMFLDTAPAIIIFAPLLAPPALAMGVSDLHFAIIMVVGLAIGLATPPLGMCLFVAMSIADLKMKELVVAMVPFFLMLIVCYFVIVFIPAFSLVIPWLAGY